MADGAAAEGGGGDRREPAPEFAEGLDWVNSDGPLTLHGLRGRVVLLDFWTYG